MGAHGGPLPGPIDLTLFHQRGLLAPVKHHTHPAAIAPGSLLQNALVVRHPCKFKVPQEYFKSNFGALRKSEDFSLLVAFLLVTFSWLFRGFFLAFSWPSSV